MTRARLIIFAMVQLLVGFAVGLIARPLLFPTVVDTAKTAPGGYAAARTAPRAVEYFEANLNEARRIVAGCRSGDVSGQECANAETAIITVESKERFKRFRAGQR